MVERESGWHTRGILNHGPRDEGRGADPFHLGISSFLVSIDDVMAAIVDEEFSART